MVVELFLCFVRWILLESFPVILKDKVAAVIFLKNICESNYLAF